MNGPEEMMFGLCLAAGQPIEEVASKTLFTVHVGGLEIPFTNHMFMIMLSSLVLMIVIPAGVRRPTLIPRGLRNAIEAICVFLREDVARPFLKERTDYYIPILWTLFFFILTLNLLGIVPLDRIFWLITGKPNWGGAATANLYITGALAVFSFLLFHAAGMKEKGVVKYFATLAPKVPWPIRPFMFLMELLSSFVRMFSLAIRLFANILSGHILLVVLLGFILIYKNFMVASASIVVTTLMSLLELFVAFLQAYIFTFLTAIFIGFAISEEEH